MLWLGITELPTDMSELKWADCAMASDSNETGKSYEAELKLLRFVVRTL